MKVENIKSENMSFEYKINFTAAEIEEALDKKVAEKAKNFKMQGFRKGHVPLNIVKQNVINSVLGDVLENLINKACDSVIREKKIEELASRPSYKFDKQYEYGKDAEVVITIDSAPLFDLKPYEFEIDKVTPKITEEDVEASFKEFLAANPVYDDVSESYVIQPGDQVKYSAKCYNKGTYSKKKSFGNTVIIPNVIPEGAEFLENFAGKKVGEEFDFVPATNKNLTYKITIKSIQKEVKGLSMKEYAEKKGIKEVDTLVNYIKQKLENKFNSQSYLYHKNQILEILTSQYSFDIPQKIFDQEMQTVIATVNKDYEDKLKAAEKDSTIKVPEKKTEEQLKEEYSDTVKKRVILGYILNKIARKENVTVSDKELIAAIQFEADNSPYMSQHILNYYRNNQQALAFKRAELVEYKVMNLLINKSKAKTTKELKQNEIDEIVKKLMEEDD
ncbi:MAG: trigger factor [Alphaproteobacteria bacterium]|nr:trigger factor [Alphaproteobacteria bacterium]